MFSIVDFMKKNRAKHEIDIADITADELIARVVRKKTSRSFKAVCCTGLLLLSLFVMICIIPAPDSPNLEESGLLSLVTASAAATAKKDFISIPTGIVKANPFVPYRNIDGDMTSDIPKFELLAPPEVLTEDSDAVRIMDTIVSGILYDKYSPSAILNIEGNDYLVKKGDTVSNYKILNITQNSVSVSLSGNTYEAGIGEILTEGTVHKNEVSNLNSKFGGRKR